MVSADNYAFRRLNWSQKTKFNLTKEEVKALNQLQKDKHIVLKPADKGNAIVSMDQDQYVWGGSKTTE